MNTIREARALRRIAGSSYYPTVDATGLYQRSKGSKNLNPAGVSSTPGGFDRYKTGSPLVRNVTP